MRSISKAIISALMLVLTACGDGHDSASETGSQTLSLTPPKPEQASPATISVNKAFAERLPLSDPSDFEDATRGLVAQRAKDIISASNGQVLWSAKTAGAFDGAAPDTVNPSLWRQSQLTRIHGLFEVADGIWQVRGYDLAVMTILKGDTGWIIIDPLTTIETAKAALTLVNDTLGPRPVSAMIYTHSHVDHFGGARGIISEEEIAARNVPVLAPIGFTKAVIDENLLAATHMGRRASLMYGFHLDEDAHGHVSSGLGPGVPQGAISLILPSEEISGPKAARVIDGVAFEFIDAAGTEAPAEFMFYLPEKRALCTAEVATATFHNILTMRGAKARDALGWSEAIDKLLVDYGARSDVVFASHHWPTWGTENVTRFLTEQRDVYRYVHDQTLRHANSGRTMTELADAISEPDFIAQDFHARGYYGSLNHNSKAVYQHYFGWWSGVPADFNRLPHETSAARYVEAMGGTQAVLRLGVEAYNKGDYRWSAELLNHLVFADASNKTGRLWLASAYEQMGFQAESGAWRSYYLAAAKELREGPPSGPAPTEHMPEFIVAIETIDLFNAMATRFNPEKMKRTPYAMRFRFPDTGEVVTVAVSKATMVPRYGDAGEAIAELTITRSDFNRLAAGEAGAVGLLLSGKLKVTGDALAPRAFFASLDTPEFWAPLVTP